MFLLCLCQLTYAQLNSLPDTLKNKINCVDVKPKFKISAYIIPTALIGYGALALSDGSKLHKLDLNIRDDVTKNHPNFNSQVDSYLIFAPALAVYALNLSGIKGKHNLTDATMLYAGSTGIMGTSTLILKKSIKRLRPDASGDQSFPSGHTAWAFASAEFLKQEYADVSPCIGYGGYVVASVVGGLRIYNNKHWLSDVVAGAGLGIASTKIAYLIYPYVKTLMSKITASKFSIVPYQYNGTKGILLCGTF